MRISDWSSDVALPICKSITFTISHQSTAGDITAANATICEGEDAMLSASTTTITNPVFRWYRDAALTDLAFTGADFTATGLTVNTMFYVTVEGNGVCEGEAKRSEEHTSELQSLIRISYAVFCLKKKKQVTN